MNIKQEIVDSISLLVDSAIQRTCPVVTFGFVVGLSTDKRCVCRINQIDYKLKYYGDALPTINQKYPVFVPFNDMSLAFIITSKSGGGEGGGITPEEVDEKILAATIDMATKSWVNRQNFAKQYYGTTQELSVYATTIPEKGTIFVYSDYKTIDGTKYAGIKVADGLAYLIDLPFVGDDIALEIANHIDNDTIHVTSTEKQFWNNKVRAYTTLIAENEYNLILSIN